MSVSNNNGDHLMLSNLVRWIMVDAVDGTEMHAVDLSYLTALTHVETTIYALSYVHPRQIRDLYQRLLERVRTAKIIKRPGRSYPRRLDRPRDLGHGHIRKPARITKPVA